MIPQWKYEAYSNWSRLIAKNSSKEEIQRELWNLEGNREALKSSHLKAVEASTSMQGNAQRRSQSGNALTGNWERLNAYRNALELHEYYHERCKQ